MPTSPLDKPLVLLTMGDRLGIGPEVTVGTLRDSSIRKLARFLVIGNFKSIEDAKRILKVSIPLCKIKSDELNKRSSAAIRSNCINVLDVECKNDGRHPVRYLDMALSLIREKIGSALVTGPVNKEAIMKSGIHFQGHTEYLAGATGTKKFAMMFVGDKLRVTAVTRHIPLKDVSRSITRDKLRDAIDLTYSFMKTRFKIKRPRVGICALNPHAGEGGLIGREEKDVIEPLINGMKRTIATISGPIPADSAFNQLLTGRIDCLVAMYHDQAMIPVKTFAREKCVNITLGLPFVRTSPVHGTAYDIAGKGIADPSSMKEATRLACALSTRK